MASSSSASLARPTYKTLGPQTRPATNTSSGVEGFATIVPHGVDASGLYTHGQQPGKSMKLVGRGGGEYQEVTTYRYVGPGAGDFKVDQLNPDEEVDCSCSTSSPIAWCSVCVLVCLGVVAWLVWPSEGHAILQRTQAAFLPKPTSPVAAQTAPLLKAAAPPHVAAAAVAPDVPSAGGFDLTLQGKEIDWSYVLDGARRQAAFDGALRAAVAFFVGHDTSWDRIDVARVPTTDTVHLDVIPACGVDVASVLHSLSLSSLSAAMTANLRATTLWEESVKGRISMKAVDVKPFNAPCSLQEFPTALRVRREEFAEAWSRSAALAAAASEKPLVNATAPSGEAALAAAASTPAAAAPVVEVDSASDPCHIVVVRGADGDTGDVVNGDYMLWGEKFDNHDLYQKVGNKEVWIAFISGRWYVSRNKDADASLKDGRWYDSASDQRASAWLYSEEATNLPGEAEHWHQWSGKEWLPKSSIALQCHEPTAG